MNRYVSLFASFLTMLCLGGVYAWSIFVPMLKKQLAFTTFQTQWIVGLTLGIFTFSMVFVGRLEKRWGTKVIAFNGATFLFLGYLLAYFSKGNFLVLCIGIGGFCGLATGCGYVCCLVVPNKLFPSQKGLATGISVAGFGAGAILLTSLVKYLTSTYPEIQVLEIFAILGWVYGTILWVCALFLTYPTTLIEEAKSPTFVFPLKDSQWKILFATMFCGTFAGLMVIGNAKPIVLSFGFAEDLATFSIMLLSLGNMAGRVFWGFSVDRFGISKVLPFAYAITLVSCVLLAFVGNETLLLILSLVGLGIGFSSNFVLFAAKTSQWYGIEKLGLVYPIIFLAYGISGIMGPIAGGWFFDEFKNYDIALFMATGITALGLAIFWIAPILWKPTPPTH